MNNVEALFNVEAQIDYLKTVFHNLSPLQQQEARKDLEHLYSERNRLENEREANKLDFGQGAESIGTIADR